MTKQEYKAKKKQLKLENKIHIKEQKAEYKEKKAELKLKKKELKKAYKERIDSLDETTDVQIDFYKQEYKNNPKAKTPKVRERDLSQEEIEKLRRDRKLPSYTRGEEIFNSVTHIVGGGFGVIGLISGIVFSAIFRPGDTMSLISMIIFGVSMILLYSISAIYHGLHINKGKQVFQVLDHCTIYFLIAGSYTPCMLLGLSNIYPWNHVFLLCVYLLAILGIVLNATMMRRKAVQIVSMILYLVIGWSIIVLAPFLVSEFKVGGMILLVSGGVSYTIGSVLYGLGRKKRYMHSIFHLFVDLGTILQFLSVLLYLIIRL